MHRMSLRRMVCTAGLVLAAWANSDAALGDRPSVERTLEAMTTAALAGDSRGYLQHVSKSDTEFRREQENWAADLTKHKPIALTLAIAESDSSPASFADERAEFEMLVSWTMAGLGEDGGNLTRTTSFPVSFAREPESGAWLFEGERWLVVESPTPAANGGAEGTAATPVPLSARARVKYMPGFEGAAKCAAELLPEVRAHVHEGFELSISRVQEVKLYPTMRHLQASIYLSYTDALSGWNEPGETIKLVVSPKAGAGQLKPLLAHEYGHVATFEMGAKATDAPWWVLEGIAELSAEKYAGSRGRKQVLDWAREKTLASWADLADFRSVPNHLHAHVYKQGHHMIGYISERFGRSGRNAWLRLLASGKSIDDASREALKMPFDALDAAWRESLAKTAQEEDRDQARPSP